VNVSLTPQSGLLLGGPPEHWTSTKSVAATLKTSSKVTQNNTVQTAHTLQTIIIHKKKIKIVKEALISVVTPRGLPYHPSRFIDANFETPTSRTTSYLPQILPS
jgi:hypothetical protein